MAVQRGDWPALLPVRDTEVELFSVAGHDGYLREVNDRFARLLGVDPGQLNDRSILELVHPEELEAIVTGLAALEGGEPEVMLENRFRRCDGGWIHLQWVARPLAGTDLWWAAGRDTTAFHRLLAEGVDLRARLDLAIGQGAGAMWGFDPTSGLLSWEPEVGAVLGVAPGEEPTRIDEFAAAVHPDDATAIATAFAELTAIGATSTAVRVTGPAGIRHLSLRGKALDRDHRGRVVRAVGLLVDVTNDKAMEEQMLRMIMSDPLTGIPNRRAFDQTLRTEWRRCARVGEPLSVVMIDIDNFKTFNDTFGHLVGDEVLCTVSRALADSLHREADSVARFGGEEFAIVLPAVDSAGALAVAQRLCEAVRQATIHRAPGWRLSVSIGTATWHPEAELLRSAQLVTRADEALYVSKEAGKDRATSFEESLAVKVKIEDAIRDGLTLGEFEMYYQPIIDLRTGSLTGFEALMRWNRPGHGVVVPDDFIPVAERSSLICDLDRFALDEATSQLASWVHAGLDPGGVLRMAVNASARHVTSPEIVSDVEVALARSGLEPTRLEIELTETALGDKNLVRTHLARLRRLGVLVSIDDFGTGYTSIGQLADLPADRMKIDRTLVSSDDPRHEGLIALMIGAARAFDLRVVAEGIEDLETLETLRELGCDEAQGFCIARPMPAAKIPAFLSHGPSAVLEWI